MKEPFSDDPKNSGLPRFKQDELNKMAVERAQAGFQLGFHAIGDKAAAMALDAFSQPGVSTSARNRIEHAQVVDPADIPRFAKLKVIASVQPYHAIDDGRWADKRIGPERVKTTYAFRSLLDAGVILAFGSDWFVAPMVPLSGIYAATTRRTLDGKNPNGWVPDQKITVREAVHAYTVGAAYASKEERNVGSLEPGKLADIAVLSDDIFHIDPVAIEKSKVDLTIFDGKVVFERK